MSILREYQQLQEQSKSLREQLISLERREDFKRESAFFNRLKSLMVDYNKSALDVVKLINAEEGICESPARRKKRKIKVYRNPYDWEIVETRGGNHKTLRAWKDQHGAEVVDSWLVEEK
ncbi:MULTISPECIES: histone-like nucleoid-structuring protein, MvaT/MvaU family [Halomonadaceae]|uniref:histone-like nucleoid-structuring protein, MvaT/MvaU family n=1 Tax=Halomonadaceae TaxID=28256 RepID=UPI00022D2AFA|nr:histone-like nucleoid-structuring protein, MvaT/MvaU family [Halomonas sp. HAL1]EHA15236.1 transcriptional regulator MvaT, P16 subunit [Halomonas sp. HAL1]WKV95097.1 histone-like nucleoid-structuring protein, MvaT/MvaU family [Halomonas sp. HAL1]